MIVDLSVLETLTIFAYKNQRWGLVEELMLILPMLENGERYHVSKRPELRVVETQDGDKFEYDLEGADFEGPVVPGAQCEVGFYDRNEVQFEKTGNLGGWPLKHKTWNEFWGEFLQVTFHQV